MTFDQEEILTKRYREEHNLANQIEKLNLLSSKWINRFTIVAIYRGWVQLDATQLQQMKNIALVDSEAVYTLFVNKKVGLELLERLSLGLEDEATRLKAVMIIKEKGVNNSKREIENIFLSASNQKNLFDFA